MIEEDAHLRGGQRTPRRVLENGPNLFKRHTGKPFDELCGGGTIF